VVFFLLIPIFSLEFRADHQLDCEHVSSQLMALGLHTATAGTGNGFFLVKFNILTSFELTICLTVSI
jgi:hypothetical protein